MDRKTNNRLHLAANDDGTPTYKVKPVDRNCNHRHEKDWIDNDGVINAAEGSPALSYISGDSYVCIRCNLVIDDPNGPDMDEPMISARIVRKVVNAWLAKAGNKFAEVEQKEEVDFDPGELLAYAFTMEALDAIRQLIDEMEAMS